MSDAVYAPCLLPHSRRSSLCDRFVAFRERLGLEPCTCSCHRDEPTLWEAEPERPVDDVETGGRL